MTDSSAPSNTGSIDPAKRVGHVKRYMFGWAGNVKDGDLVMHERPDGMWVKYDDMLAEIKSLTGETNLSQNSTRAVSALEDIPVKGTAGTNPIPEVQELIDRLRHRATRAEHGADVRAMDDAADFLERFSVNQEVPHGQD